MQATKLERIIFDERDISCLEAQMEETLRYANGEVNLYSKFAPILSDAEELIAEISLQTDFSERNHFLLNLWDDHYYYDWEEYDSFIENFVKRGAYAHIIRLRAKDSYHEQIEAYSPSNQLAKYERLKIEVYIAKEKLSAKMLKLSVFEKLRLKLLRNDPTARINSSPSFIFCCDVGDAMIQGLKAGLKNPIA